MFVSDVFVDAEFKYVPEFLLSPTSFAPSQRAGIFYARTLKCVFMMGTMKNSKDFFSQEDGAVFCNDVCSVMEVLGHEYNPDRWRLFIDSSKVSLKVVLLHKGNRFPSVPLAHAANMMESYESMKLLLVKIKYDEFK
jgi:hypothetical protein